MGKRYQAYSHIETMDAYNAVSSMTPVPLVTPCAMNNHLRFGIQICLAFNEHHQGLGIRFGCCDDDGGLPILTYNIRRQTSGKTAISFACTTRFPTNNGNIHIHIRTQVLR